MVKSGSTDGNGRDPNKDGKGRWIKGNRANPKGRLKGQYPISTQKFMAVKEIAAQHADKAFKMVWDAMEAKESWAFQIYFKELFHIPRNYGEKTVILEKEERTIDGQIKVITEALPEFDEVTQAESLERLKVLNSIKNPELNLIQVEEVRESKESLREKVELIQQIMEFKDKV